MSNHRFIPTGDKWHPIDFMVRHRLTVSQFARMLEMPVATIRGYTEAKKAKRPPATMRWALMYFEEKPELIDAAAFMPDAPENQPVDTGRPNPRGFNAETKWTPRMGVK